MADNGSIIKSGRKEGFTVLYNSMIKDKRLSLKAKGLFAVMMSRPENWQFSVSGLASYTGTGKDSIRSILGELERVGYLVREQAHKEDGTFGGNIYVLQDIAPPLSGKPDDGETRQRKKPLPGNPTQRNKDLKKDCIITPLPPGPEAGKTPADVGRRAAEYAGGDRELLDAIFGLLENRRVANHKPVKTLRAINGILRDLDERSRGNREMKLRLLEKATLSNWLTVYALKENDIPPSARQEEEDLDGI